MGKSGPANYHKQETKFTKSTDSAAKAQASSRVKAKNKSQTANKRKPYNPDPTW